MLKYICPYCEKHVLIADEERDQQVKCPHCDMLGVAYGVNVRATDAPNTPAGHVAERHETPDREPRRTSWKPTPPPPPPPPSVSVIPVTLEPPGDSPPPFPGAPGQDAPDLGPEQLLRARVRRTLTRPAAGRARQMGVLSVVSGALACVLGLASAASLCLIMLPAICTVLAFMFAANADKFAKREASSRESASAVKMALLGRILGVIGIVLALLIWLARV